MDIINFKYFITYNSFRLVFYNTQPFFYYFIIDAVF